MKTSLEKCVLCSSPKDRFEPCGKKSGYTICRCKSCSLVFINPRDEAATLHSQYLKNKTSPTAYYAATVDSDRENFVQVLERIESICPKGKLLDVGCNVGTFLQCAAERGWRVQGIDANEDALQVCRRNAHQVFRGIFGRDAFPGLAENTLDWISMNDTIEHFLDPKEAVITARSYLKNGGILSVITPNLESFLARAFQVKPKEHLFYFTRDTLSKLFGAAGLEPVFVEEWPRNRDVGSMHLGASFENPLWVSVSKALKITHLDSLTNRILEILFKEQIVAIARKP